jgi:hypothetical protein
MKRIAALTICFLSILHGAVFAINLPDWKDILTNNLHGKVKSVIQKTYFLDKTPSVFESSYEYTGFGVLDKFIQKSPTQTLFELKCQIDENQRIYRAISKSQYRDYDFEAQFAYREDGKILELRLQHNIPDILGERIYQYNYCSKI